MATSFDVTLFWIAFWCYLGGFLVFSTWLSLRKPWLTTFGVVLYICGFIPQTIGFILRWINSGHYPMSNMYEYLAVMSWMAVLSFGFLTYKYRQWVISALITPIVVMLMVSASLLPKEPSMQLMPALKSNWLAIHVSLASIGSGAFAVGAAVSMILLLFGQDKNEKSLFSVLNFKATGITLFAIPVVLMIIGGAGGLFTAHTKMGFFGNPNPGFGSACILLGIYLPLAGFVWARLLKGRSSAEHRYWASLGFTGLFFGALISGLMIKGEYYTITPESPLRIFEFFGMTFIFGVIALFIFHSIFTMSKLPEKLRIDTRLLDEVNYRAVTLGYPLYTLGALFAGAIWAESAWGSFWSWDPKEVGALIIWLFYSAFLHARYNRGWSGSRTAILSLCGFAMMMLSFFGNYFFGGLHAYN